MWDSWHSWTPTLSLPIPVLHSHTLTRWHYILVTDIGSVLKCQLLFSIFIYFSRLFILNHPVFLSSDARYTLALTSSEAPIFVPRECVCAVSVVKRFTIRGYVPGSLVWHLPLFWKSMLIKIVLFPVKFHFEGENLWAVHWGSQGVLAQGALWSKSTSARMQKI